MKHLLKKTLFAKEDSWIGFLNYRMALMEDGKALCELLMGRKLRGWLPDFAECRAPEVKKHTQERRSKHPLPPLSKKDQVRILGKDGWTTKASVKKPLVEDGGCLRQNRQHLLKTPEDFSKRHTYKDDWEDVAAAQPENMWCAPYPGEPQSGQWQDSGHFEFSPEHDFVVFISLTESR